MKLSKDTVNGQKSYVQKQSIVRAIRSTGATMVAISVPLDTNAQMIAVGTTPGPQTIEKETQDWCDVIHAAGMNVLHRGTFSGTEAIWGFPYYIFGSGDQLNTGTGTSAPTDGENTFCGRILRYITTNVGQTHWIDGDLFAPIPEATSHAFDGNNWWDPAASTTNYAAAFAEFKATSDAQFTAWAISVKFQSHNNYSEVRSGWIPNSVFTEQGIAGVDYYGGYVSASNVQVQDYIDDIIWVYTNKGVPVFWSEWGDLPNALPANVLTIDQRLNWLIQFYFRISQYCVDTGKLVGFNYWGGWDAQNTSIMLIDGTSNYQPNARGKILAQYYSNQANLPSGLIRAPIVSGSTDDTYTF